jgi:hypothetical protein
MFKKNLSNIINHLRYIYERNIYKVESSNLFTENPSEGLKLVCLF